MDRRDLLPKRELKPKPPKWSSPLWYLPFMLVMVWLWQTTIVQLSYRTILYSEFKAHLRSDNVVECTLTQDTIQGKIDAKNPLPPSMIPTNAPGAAKAGPEKKQFYFRTVRVEDSKLVEELEAAKVNFNGERPSFLSQFLIAWILPIGVIFLIWSFISRRLGSAGE